MLQPGGLAGEEDDDQTFGDAAVQAVAHSLLCPICKEYYDCCMLLPACSHSFCSLCIRRTLEFHHQCPVCKSAAEAHQLVANRPLDDAVRAFRAATPTLTWLIALRQQQQQQQQALAQAQAEAAQATAQKPRGGGRGPGRPSKPAAPSLSQSGRLTRSMAQAVMLELGDSSDEEDTKGDSEFEGSLSTRTRSGAKRRQSERGGGSSNDTSTSASSSRKKAKMEPEVKLEANEPRPPPGAGPGPAVRPGMVACPICGLAVPEAGINLHLDRCLRLSNGSSSAPSHPPKTPKAQPTAPAKPLPTARPATKGERLKCPVFHLLNMAQLKQLLGRRGLLTAGERSTLIRRYKEYVVRHNANLDQPLPRPEAAIVAQFNKEEEARCFPQLGRVAEKALPGTQTRSSAEQFAALRKELMERMPKRTTASPQGATAGEAARPDPTPPPCSQLPDSVPPSVLADGPECSLLMSTPRRAAPDAPPSPLAPAAAAAAAISAPNSSVATMAAMAALAAEGDGGDVAGLATESSSAASGDAPTDGVSQAPTEPVEAPPPLPDDDDDRCLW
eukprot:EG_transcript_7531